MFAEARGGPAEAEVAPVREIAVFAEAQVASVREIAVFADVQVAPRSERPRSLRASRSFHSNANLYIAIYICQIGSDANQGNKGTVPVAIFWGSGVTPAVVNQGLVHKAEGSGQ